MNSKWTHSGATFTQTQDCHCQSLMDDRFPTFLTHSHRSSFSSALFPVCFLRTKCTWSSQTSSSLLEHTHTQCIWEHIYKGEKCTLKKQTLLMGIGDYLYNMCVTVAVLIELLRLVKAGELEIHTAKWKWSTLAWLCVWLHQKPFTSCTTQHPASTLRVLCKWRDLRFGVFVVLTFVNVEGEKGRPKLRAKLYRKHEMWVCVLLLHLPILVNRRAAGKVESLQARLWRFLDLRL